MVSLLAAAGCSTGHAAVAHRVQPAVTDTPSLEPLTPPSVKDPTKPQKPGLHVDAAVVRLGRSVGVDVVQELRSTEQRALSILHGRPTHIRVSLDDRLVVAELGAGGSMAYNRSITIDVGTGAPVGTRSTLQVWVPFMLAHQLVHAVQIEDGPGLAPRLLETIVFEGLADSFAATIVPGASAPLRDIALTAAEMHKAWRRAQDVLYSNPSSDDLGNWLFGGDGIPRFAGFSLGAAIIRAVRERHPHLSWAKLVHLDAQSILDLSHFRP